MPTKRPRRSGGSEAARRVIEIDDVFDGEDRIRRRHRGDLREEIALHRLVLEHGLDDQLGVARRVGERRRDGYARELLVVLLLGQLAARHRALERRTDARSARLGTRHLRFVKHHLVSRRGHHLADAVAHQTGAAHEDPSVRHGP